jgi:hypothetical protein
MFLERTKQNCSLAVATKSEAPIHLSLPKGEGRVRVGSLVGGDLSSKTWTGLFIFCSVVGVEFVFEFQWRLVLHSAVKTRPVIEGFDVIE